MRDPEKPIGRIARTGRGLVRLAANVHWFAAYEGPQRVFVDDKGAVYCMPDGLLCTDRMVEAHFTWMVGTYRAPGKRAAAVENFRARIAGDLQERIDELWRRAA